MDATENKRIADAVETYSDTVFRVAYQYLRDRADAEDVVQDVFLRLIDKPPGEEKALKAWLIRVAINRSKDMLRARKRQRKLVTERAEARESGEVFDALTKLPARDRDALYLHYYEGYTAREIAAITGGTERAVTKRLGRAREKLKNFLEEV